MAERDYIVFSDEWGRHPSSCEHIIRQLLPENRVIWVNTIGMRTPGLTFYDMRRSIEKMAAWMRPHKEERGVVPENLHLVEPVMLPFNNIPAIREMNRISVERAVQKVMRRQAVNSPVVVASVTNAADYVTLFDAAAILYYCVDEYLEWPGVDRKLTAGMEERLLAVSNLVLATSDDLCRKKTRGDKIPLFLPHGVEVEHFARACAGRSELYEGIGGPVIGFFGAISAWLDFALIRGVAEARPDWTLLFIGPVDTDIAALEGVPNIRLTGKVPYSDLPRHAAGFDASIIPFAINELTVSVNPLKLLEYLACGLPVVSTDMPEVRKFGDDVAIAGDVPSFVSALERALAENSLQLRQQRQETAARYSWRSIAEDFSICVDRAITARSSALRQPPDTGELP